MIIRSLRLQQFRSYADASFAFTPGVNVIVGKNGTGKTNLLEAVYVLATGSSFRVADKELVSYSQDWFRLDATFDSQQRSVLYRAGTPGKQLIVNDGAKKRFTRVSRLPVVLFEPEMLRVLSGSPARRRELLDGLISQWFIEGASLLRRYERVLAQRNAVLKNAYELSSHLLEDQLFAWDVSFAELADRVEQHRQMVIERLAASLGQTYSAISGKEQAVQVKYHGSAQHGQTAFLQALRSHRRLDVARGYTTIGPHRSDFQILLNRQPAETTASRGEQRSLVLAIKQVEVMELERLHDDRPMLLLDDVMSELDTSRQGALQKMLNQGQSILTTTKTVSIPGVKKLAL